MNMIEFGSLEILVVPPRPFGRKHGTSDQMPWIWIPCFGTSTSTAAYLVDRQLVAPTNLERFRRCTALLRT